MSLDLINADTRGGITVAQMREDATIHVTLADGELCNAFRFEHGEVTDRWKNGVGPCDENWHPLERIAASYAHPPPPGLRLVLDPEQVPPGLYEFLRLKDHPERP
jgi:hypothetical protein